MPERTVFMTLHRAASMGLWRWLRSLSGEAGVAHYAGNSRNFPDDSSIVEDPAPIARLSGLIGPIRGFVDLSALPETQQVFQLRDPRDVLVSTYYAFTFMHELPEGAAEEEVAADRRRWQDMGIDAFVLHDKVLWGPSWRKIALGSDALVERYRAFCHVLARRDAILLRYEDLFFDFDAWWSPFRQALLPWIPPDHLERFREKVADDVRPPEHEDILAHQRHMIPGDHREKLKPATIAALDKKFADALAFLRYSAAK